MAGTDLEDPAVRFIALLAVGLTGLVFGALAYDADAIASLPFALGIAAVVPFFSRAVRLRVATAVPDGEGGADSTRDAVRAFVVVGVVTIVGQFALAFLPEWVRSGVAGVAVASFVLLLAGLATGIRPRRA